MKNLVGSVVIKLLSYRHNKTFTNLYKRIKSYLYICLQTFPGQNSLDCIRRRICHQILLGRGFNWRPTAAGDCSRIKITLFQWASLWRGGCLVAASQRLVPTHSTWYDFSNVWIHFNFLFTSFKVCVATLKDLLHE